MLKKSQSLFPARSLFLFFILASLILPLSLSAQYTPSYDSNTLNSLTNSGLANMLNAIYSFFGSGYMKAICMVALGGLGAGMIMNRGEPGMVKKFIPWAVGIVIMLSISTIMEIIWVEPGKVKPN